MKTTKSSLTSPLVVCADQWSLWGISREKTWNTHHKRLIHDYVLPFIQTSWIHLFAFTIQKGDSSFFNSPFSTIPPSRRIIHPSKRVNGRVNRVIHYSKGERRFVKYSLAQSFNFTRRPRIWYLALPLVFNHYLKTVSGTKCSQKTFFSDLFGTLCNGIPLVSVIPYTFN